jgi:CubicO group peptidase (beta-lactamase class C family)
MKLKNLCRMSGSILAVMLGLSASLAAQQAVIHPLDMTQVKPESVGFSSERLDRLHTVLRDAVRDKGVSGVVTVLVRHGKLVDFSTYGQSDIASNTPMARNTLFRIFSMTKPVTAVAMLELYEQGKWLPNDPIAKYIPEFAHLKVFNGFDATGKMVLVDPDHAPTMGELMSHTAGFSYGFFGDSPVDAMYRDEKVMQSHSLQEMIDKLAKIPLLYQPGKGWTYSVSMDIEGYLVEKLSGQTLPDYYRDHIFKPLEMHDASFQIAKSDLSRFAQLYVNDEKGNLVPSPSNGFQRDYTVAPEMPSGGGGMVATAEDYVRFAQMLANEGELNGHRLLSPASVRLMRTNHVPHELLEAQKFGIGPHHLRPGFGYGYNCAVVYNPGEANLPDGAGTFFWDGAAGTWYWVDPVNDIVFVGMIQRMGTTVPPLEYQSHSLVYQALVEPAK